jgi:hypothetical protein
MSHSDTKPLELLSDVVNNKQLCRGVKQLSPKCQTSSLEAFHSVLLHFAPKLLAYSYEEMWCRYDFKCNFANNKICCNVCN